VFIVPMHIGGMATYTLKRAEENFEIESALSSEDNPMMWLRFPSQLLHCGLKCLFNSIKQYCITPSSPNSLYESVRDIINLMPLSLR
jgi:hypothetical protein